MLIQSVINLRNFILLLCLCFIVSSTLLKVRKKKETRKNNPRKPALWRGRREGGRGFREKCQRRGPNGADEQKWKPCTNLGRLVQEGIVTSLEEIYHPIKEPQIVDTIYERNTIELREEYMKIKSVQKQKPDKEQDLKLLLLLVMEKDILVLVLKLQKKFKFR